MPRTDNEIRVTPSVLDRLIDYEPKKSTEAPATRSESLRDMKKSVKRDIEWLLNTRQSNVDITSDLEEVGNSVAAYGLPDFSHLSMSNPFDIDRLKEEIETVIDRFEPRLRDVRVTIESIPVGEKVVHFRIDARLRVEPAPEPIAFDSVMRLGSGECVVKES